MIKWLECPACYPYSDWWMILWNIQNWIKLDQNWIKMDQNGSKWIKQDQRDQKWIKMDQKWIKMDQKWIKMGQNGSKWIKNGSNRIILVQIELKMDQNGSNWIQLDQLMDDTPKSLTYIRRDLKFQNGFLRPQLDPGQKAKLEFQFLAYFRNTCIKKIWKLVSSVRKDFLWYSLTL